MFLWIPGMFVHTWHCNYCDFLVNFLLLRNWYILIDIAETYLLFRLYLKIHLYFSIAHLASGSCRPGGLEVFWFSVKPISHSLQWKSSFFTMRHWLLGSPVHLMPLLCATSTAAACLPLCRRGAEQVRSPVPQWKIQLCIFRSLWSLPAPRPVLPVALSLQRCLGCHQLPYTSPYLVGI